MDKFMIVGGNPLQGTIRASGSKNATLPILTASLLNGTRTVIRDVPALQDVSTMCDVLQYLGASVTLERGTITVDTSDIYCMEVSEDLMRRMRASNLVLGPLLGRFRRARISYPGGCNIGSRPMICT